MIVNQMTNIINYTPESGHIQVKARIADGEECGVYVKTQELLLIQSISREIVERHNGVIRLHRGGDSGSTFIVRLMLTKIIQKEIQ